MTGPTDVEASGVRLYLNHSMSTPGHKRKRSLQDSPVNLTTMQVARKQLLALQEELSGIQEIELSEMEEIMKHVDALAVILGSGKKLVSNTVICSDFPSLTRIVFRNFPFHQFSVQISRTWD